MAKFDGFYVNFRSKVQIWDESTKMDANVTKIL